MNAGAGGQVCTLQYSTVMYSIVQYSTLQCSAECYSTVQCSTHSCLKWLIQPAGREEGAQ